MPTYTYECESCAHRFDAVQKITESPLITCPVCREQSLKKLLTSGNFVLKGERWFKKSGEY